MPKPAPAAAELQAALALILAGAAGGDVRDWAASVGPVTVHPPPFRPKCNWTIEPKGNAAQIRAIEKAARILARELPYARRDELSS